MIDWSHLASDLPPWEQIEMVPPIGFRRSYPDVGPGTWSDDGAQALCLLATLLHCNGFDADDFGRRLQNWRYLGYMAVGGEVFDVGITSQKVIERLASGTPADQAGERGAGSNGNGSLMRALPLVLWHTGTDEKLMRDAMRQSQVTHAHIRSQLCCALYSLWARGILEGRDNAWDGAVTAVQRLATGNSDWNDELQDQVLTAAMKPVRGTGYVVDCLWSARQACEGRDFESVVKNAIALGNDTDTTACVAGGIAGIGFGISGIPIRWLEALRDCDEVQPLLKQLLAIHGA